jgi:hypothetical protein
LFSLIFWCVLKDVKVLVQLLIELQDARQIFKSVAVVWRRPDCGQFTAEHLIETFLGQLVGSVDPLAIVCMEELRHDILTEHVTSTPLAKTKPLYVGFRV